MAAWPWRRVGGGERGFRRAKARRATFRPRVEELEARLAPSVDMLTYHNGNANHGKSQSETILTPSNVNASTFGKRFSTPVDGFVYAQPLYKSAVNISTLPNAGTHNVVYVATEHDSVYALDGASGLVLWKTSFLNPSAGVTTVPSTDVHGVVLPEIGITSTPVIDPTTNTLYVMAYTKEVTGATNNYVYRLHALDITNGQEQFGGPLLVADTAYDGISFTFVSGPFVNGTGTGSPGGKVPFNAVRELQRPGLTLVNGQVYAAFGSHGDLAPTHGWLLGFRAGTGQLQLTAAFNTTPNGNLGSIWQSGAKVAADTSGFLYLETGNGTFDTTLNSSHFPSKGDYGDSFLKLAVDSSSSPSHQNINGWGLKVVDYFTPFNQQALAAADLDLGSGAPLVFPGSVGNSSHPNLLIGGGKQGTLYLIDRNNMGKFDPTGDHVVQEVHGLFGTGIWGAPEYINGNVYIAGSNSTNNTAKVLSISNAKLSSPTSQTTDTFGFEGAQPTLSANVTSNVILWTLDRTSGQLRAYDGSNLGTEIYTSVQAPNRRDVVGLVVKFTTPTVANGFVYVGTTNALVAYGLLGPKTAGAAAPADQSSLASVVPILDTAASALHPAATGVSTAVSAPMRSLGSSAADDSGQAVHAPAAGSHSTWETPFRRAPVLRPTPAWERSSVWDDSF
jgi:hypothetical protein